MDQHLTPEQHREQAKKRLAHAVVRLQDELDKMIKLFSAAREAVENEMMEGMGYKKLALTDKDMKKLVGLADLASSVVSTKIRFDKASRQMADTMTPEEERKAVISYLKAAEPRDREYVLTQVKEWQDRRNARADSIPPSESAGS